MSAWHPVAEIKPGRASDGEFSPSIMQAPDGVIYLSAGLTSWPLTGADLRRLRKMLMTAVGDDGAPVAHEPEDGRLS